LKTEEKYGMRGLGGGRGTSWYVSFEHGSYPGPQQSSLAWVVTQKSMWIRFGS